MRKTVLALGLVAMASSAAAQDYGNLAGDFAMLEMQNQTMNNALGIGGRSAPSRGVAPTRITGGSYFAAPAQPGAYAASFPFQSTPASRKAAVSAYVSRIAKSDPQAARATATEMARHDISRVYAGIIAPFGLRANDAADALTAYTVLGYLIATGAGDPSARQVRAVRAQVAARAADNPSFAPGRRAQLGEEMKLLFVTLHAGWQSARKEGNLRQYSDGVARLFAQSDIHLRSLRLTDQGFAGR